MARPTSERASGKTTVLMLGLFGDDPATTRYYGGIARTLDPSRHTLLFGTVRDAGQVQERVAEHGHRTFSLGCRSARDYPRAVLTLARLIRDEKVDVVHGNEELPSFLSGLAASLARHGIRIYHRQHDASVSYDPAAPPEGALLKRLGLRLASAKYSAVDRMAGAAAHAVFTLSRTHCATVLAERPQWASKVMIVPHGVDEPRDWRPHHERAAALRRELGLSEGEGSLTIVARLNWRKGHAVLFEALARLRRETKVPALLVVGYGPLEAELRSRAAALGLERVLFLGKQLDVWPYYLASDATLVPSVTEPFGLVSIEAMACARPVLASAVGGLREIVVEGATGRLLPAGDADALAAAIRDTLANRHALSVMGMQGRRRYEIEYSQEAMTRRWQEAYAALLARGGHPPTS